MEFIKTPSLMHDTLSHLISLVFCRILCRFPYSIDKQTITTTVASGGGGASRSHLFIDKVHDVHRERCVS